MTPAEQLVMAIDSPILEGLDAHERLCIAIDGMGDYRYGYLSAGERVIMQDAAALDRITNTLAGVDETWRERIGDAVARTAAIAWSGVAS